MLEFMYENFIDLICFQMNYNKLPLGKFEQPHFICKSTGRLTARVSLFKTLIKTVKT